MEKPDALYRQFEVKEGIVFLIDLAESIHEPLEGTGLRSQLCELLTCVNDLMAEMVMTYPSNGVSVQCYNCATTSKRAPKDLGLDKLFSLNDLNSSNMKLLNELLRRQEADSSTLESKYPPHRKDNLHTILLSVLREFQAKPHYNVRKLFWFTNTNTPYSHEAFKDTLRTVISDYADNHIQVTPVMLQKPVDLLLYERIFLNTNFLDFAITKGSVATQIKESVARLREVRRVLFACNLVLSDGPKVGGSLGCSVRGYTLYNHEQVRPFRKVYNQDVLRLVHNELEQVREDTGAAVNTVTRGFSLKGEYERVLYLTPETLDHMRNYCFDNDPNMSGDAHKDAASVGDNGLDNADVEVDNGDAAGEDAGAASFARPPYLKLLCFRPLQRFQPHFGLKAPAFVTANTSAAEGYSELLATLGALYRACVKQQKYGVLFGCIKRNSNPRLYALYPTRCEHLRLGIGRELPQGFLLTDLPWIGEVRSLPEHAEGWYNAESVPLELRELYKKTISRFRVDSYDPSTHPNPLLNYFYKVVKQEALQIEVGAQGGYEEDWLAQEVMQVRRAIERDVDAQEIIGLINEIVNKIGNDDVAKRGVTGDATKRQRRSLSKEDALLHWRQDSWTQVTVPQLKEFIANNGLSAAGRKADMVHTIVDYLKHENAGKSA